MVWIGSEDNQITWEYSLYMAMKWSRFVWIEMKLHFPVAQNGLRSLKEGNKMDSSC